MNTKAYRGIGVEGQGPNGTRASALIIDLRGDATNESIGRDIEHMRLGPINRLLTKLTFRFILLKRAYTKRRFEELVKETGFKKVDIKEQVDRLGAWTGKS